MESLLQDLRYAVRGLLKSRAFAAVAIVTLALGIGANSAIFTVVNSVLLKPLEYRDPDRLVFIHSQFPSIGFDKFWISPPEYRELQQRARSFSEIGAWRAGTVSLSGIDNPVRVPSAVASAELFGVLGVDAQIGRAYTTQEDVQGGDPVAVISDAIWRSVFGADPSILGRAVELNGTVRTIVGVMPPGFDLEDAGIDVWLPLALPSNPTNRGSHFLNLVGRLAPGITLAQAGSEMEGLLGTWSEFTAEQHVPNDSTHRIAMASLSDEVVGEIRPALLLLLGSVGFVLLIACANVANLLLARAEARQKEVAVRTALGAGWWRLLRQFLTESVLLALIGGAVGLLLGHWGLRLLLAVSPDSIPRSEAIGLDPWVLLFTAGVAVLTGVVFGLAPLLHLSQRSMGLALKDGGQRSTATAGRQRIRRMLVVSEIGLAVVLVIGSGLLLRSFAALRDVDPGFDPGGLLTFGIFLPANSYPEPSDQTAFFNRLTSELEALPGVRQAAAMAGLPPLREVNANTTQFEGKEETPDGPAHNVDYYQVVSGDYFDAMRIPIVQGRAFTAGDDIASNTVAIVNERLVRVFYSGEDPIGRRVRLSGNDNWMTIVGVAGDVKQGGLAEEVGTELYVHYPQVTAIFGGGARNMNVVVRSDRPPLSLASEVRRTLRVVDPSLPLAELQSMEANIAGSVNRPRFMAMLLTIFAAVALALAAIGTYGVLSYSVAERNKEIGIRMAMGAEEGAVLGMILRDGLIVAGIGLALGVIGAFVLTRLMSSLLFEVSNVDPITFVLAPALLAFVALISCYLPARRATRVDPIIALRQE